MYRLHGLGADLMVSGKEAAAVGGSALLGAAVAVKVSKFVKEIGLEKADDGSIPAQKISDATKKNEPTLPGWVAPLVPIAVGVAVHNFGKAKFPLAAPGVAAGMVAVGLGQLVGALFIKPDEREKKDSTSKMIADYVPFAGLGADVYDYSLQGFGNIGPGDVTAYMRQGLMGSPFTATEAYNTSIMSPGAPVQIQSLAGLGMGAPTSAQVISTSPSMSAALVG